MAPSLTLAPDEAHVADILIPASLTSRSHYVLTTKRLVVQARRTFLGLFALGTTEATYPLVNIASVAYQTRFSVGWALAAVLFLLVGLLTLAHGFGILLVLLGAWFGVLSFGGALAVTNTAGQTIRHPVWINGRAAAQAFAGQITATIAARS
jgi:hypothetical protein